MNPLEYIELKSLELSENKFFIGFTMIIVNIGARFIIEELSDEHREMIKGPILRKVIVFSSIFMATRDIFVSLILTGVFSLFIHEILKDDVEDKDTSKKQSINSKKELEKEISKLTMIKDTL